MGKDAFNWISKHCEVNDGAIAQEMVQNTTPIEMPHDDWLYRLSLYVIQTGWVLINLIVIRVNKMVGQIIPRNNVL